MNYFLFVILYGLSTKFHSYKTLFSQETIIVFANGLTAELTIGATNDYNNILPFLSSLSIFSNNELLRRVTLALSSTTIKSLQENVFSSFILS